MSTIKTIKEIAGEVGVSKQAVFKRMSKDPLKSALTSLPNNGVVVSGSKKILLTEEAEHMIKSAFVGKASVADVPHNMISDIGVSTPTFNVAKVNTQSFAAAAPVARQADAASLAEGMLIKELRASIDYLKYQLEMKDEQLTEKDIQIRAKDEQLKAKDDQINALHQTNRELSESLKHISKLVVNKFYKLLRRPVKVMASSEASEVSSKPVVEPSNIVAETVELEAVVNVINEEVLEMVDEIDNTPEPVVPEVSNPEPYPIDFKELNELNKRDGIEKRIWPRDGFVPVPEAPEAEAEVEVESTVVEIVAPPQADDDKLAGEKYLQALVGDIDIPQEAYQKPQLVVKEVPAEVLPVQPPVPTPAPKTLEWQPPQEVKKVQKKYFEDVEPVAAVEDSFEFDLPFLRWR